MASGDDALIDIIIPTAINVVLMVNQNIVDNLRKDKKSDLELPSIYRRARLVVGETAEVAIVRQSLEVK